MPEQIHILNVCFVVDKLERSWGGTAGNIAYTMKLLGGEPRIVSAVGRDADIYLEHFKKCGISTEHIIQNKEKLTASAYVTTDADDNQITAFYNGPLGDARSIASITKSPLTGGLTGGVGETLANTPHGHPPARGELNLAVVSPTDKNTMLKHVHECSGLGIPVMFDPGQQTTAFTDVELRSAISKSHFVVGNDYEMRLIQGRTDWSAEDILKEAKVLITTLGEKGSVISTREGEIIEVAPCPPESFDDPTGAGDAFRAGFLVGYEKGLPLKTCAQIGSVAASYAIETYGTQEHEFTKEEFGERYEKKYSEKIIL